jgi:hypothetical protein
MDHHSRTSGTEEFRPWLEQRTLKVLGSFLPRSVRRRQIHEWQDQLDCTRATNGGPRRELLQLVRSTPSIAWTGAPSLLRVSLPALAAAIMAALILWPAGRTPLSADDDYTIASLSNATVDYVDFGQYLAGVTQSRSPYRPAQLEHRGAVIGFDLNVKGYMNEHLPLHWQLIDARTGDQVDQSRDLLYVPKASDDHNSLLIWVPVPRSRNRRYFVEVQLLKNRGTIPVGRIRTKRFSGA